VNNILGMSDEEMKAMHERFHRENPTAPRSRCHQCWLEKQEATAHAIKTLCQIVREDATITVKELAAASDHRPSWVRRILTENGLAAPEAIREPKLPRSQRPCTRCGHLKHCHCWGKAPRRHVQNSALGISNFICPRVPHCKGVIEAAPGQFTNCSCDRFTLTVEKKPKKSFGAAA
jgi:hypothetical protein